MRYPGAHKPPVFNPLSSRLDDPATQFPPHESTPVMLFCQFHDRLPRTTLLVLLLMMVVSTGCVRRRLTVRTNPPGATVFVDNQRIGTSPCSVDFTYYGTREIRMIKSGFETLTVDQPIPTPSYNRPGIDFITENLLPTKIRDNRVVSFNLSPQQIVPTDELISRGQQLREQANTAPVDVLPLTTTVAPGSVPITAPTPPPAPGSSLAPAFTAPSSTGSATGSATGPATGPASTAPVFSAPP